MFININEKILYKNLGILLYSNKDNIFYPKKDFYCNIVCINSVIVYFVMNEAN